MANTTRGRVWREFFLVAFVAALVVPFGAATANQSAQLSNDVYGWEPLGVIAGSSELRLHSIGEDVWEVWVCDTPSGDVALTPESVAQRLNGEVGSFYRWLSGDAYRPVFRPGGTVAEGAGCTAAVAAQVTSQPNGVIVVTDEASNGGSAQSGIWCPYEGLCPPSPTTYPGNFRSVTLGAHAVAGPNPRTVTVVHELGHTIHFGHTFSGETTGTWAEYDNPIDVMSKAGDRTSLMGTLALNRYIAGWIEPEQVVLVDAPGSYTLSALGGAGDQLLIVSNGEQGWYSVIDARVKGSYDTALPSAGVAVHVLDQRAEACGSPLPCFGLSRRVSQWPAIADSSEHLLAVGGQVTLPNGWTLAVGERSGDQFTVSLTDPAAPPFTGPVVAAGVEVSSVSLSWPTAAWNGPVTYDVALDGEYRQSTTATSVVLTGLAPGRQYEVRVTARDGGGNQMGADPILINTLSAREKWAAHEPTSGRWLFRLGEGVVRSIYYGVPGDLPLLCDWDGDGEDTVGLYRPYEGFVYLRNSNTLGFADVDFFYGIPTDIPVCGDWDGDGRDSMGIYRPSEHRFYLRDANSLGFADHVIGLGVAGDIPLAGDWDGDGIDTVAVFRASTGAVYGVAGEVWPLASVGKVVTGDLTGTGRDVFATFVDGVITYIDEAGFQQLIRFGPARGTALAGWWS